MIYELCVAGTVPRNYEGDDDTTTTKTAETTTTIRVTVYKTVHSRGGPSVVLTRIAGRSFIMVMRNEQTACANADDCAV